MEKNSLIKKLDSATLNGSKYPLVPTNYNAINTSLKETEHYRKEIEKQLKHSDTYLSIRKFFREKILGKRVQTIDELFDSQIAAMYNINYSLEVINNEARYRLSLLERYIERINYDYENNFLNIDCKKDSLSPLLDQYILLSKEFNSLRKRDSIYFKKEKELRELKRNLSENGLEYQKMIDIVDDLEKERGSLNALEDFFRYSIHLSERMVEKAKRFESHVSNTKDSYIMAKNINCGFAAVLMAVQSSAQTILQLQEILTEGLADMGTTIADPNIPPYSDFEKILKSRQSAIQSRVNNSDENKEKLIEMQKKGLIK